MDALLVFLAGVTLLPLDLAVTGYLFATMWRWFAVPLGAHPVGAAHALGIAATLAMACKSYVPSKDDKDESAGLAVAKAYAVVIVRALATLTVGAIAHHYMVTP